MTWGSNLAELLRAQISLLPHWDSEPIYMGLFRARFQTNSDSFESNSVLTVP